MIKKSNNTNESDGTVIILAETNRRLEQKPKETATPFEMQPLEEERTHVTNKKPDSGSLTYVQLSIGSVIKDTYELVALLGIGGMGTVYKALNRVWADVGARDPYVAIKILKPELSENRQLERALYSDFDRTKLLADCPNIIKVYGFDRDGPLVYMTMEYLNGQTLGDYLNHEPMNLEKAWFIIEGIGNALYYAHKNNIVHRDIKPGNIIITEDNVVKVLDFGIASKINERKGDETKFSGHELGALTVAYASPEMQRDCPLPPDARDDIYAFACVIYEILTGKQFYKQKTLKAEPISGLNSRQMEALNKSLAFERDQRTPSVNLFLNKLRLSHISWVKYLSIGGSMLILIVAVLWKTQLNTNQLSNAQPEHLPTTQHLTQSSIPVPAKIDVPASIPNNNSLPIATPLIWSKEKTAINTELGYSNTSIDGFVQLQTSKPQYKNGESFQLSFKLALPMYVRIIDRDTSGVLTILRPNPRQPDKILPANKELVFPPKGINLPVKGESGHCTVTMIASSKPFSKSIKLLNDDGSVSPQVHSKTYSWTQVRYTLNR